MRRCSQRSDPVPRSRSIARARRRRSTRTSRHSPPSRRARIAMAEEKKFEPKTVNVVETGLAEGKGDRRDGRVYVYDKGKDEANLIELAVQSALAAGRPLLLSGPSGSGKSSLAFNVAAT